MCVCALSVYSALRVQKRAPDPVELELQALLSYHMDAGK